MVNTAVVRLVPAAASSQQSGRYRQVAGPSTGYVQLSGVGARMATAAGNLVIAVNLKRTVSNHPSDVDTPLILAEFTPADVAMLERAARKGVRYLEEYSPDDDEDDKDDLR